jgi:hypothetical protein
MKSLIFCVLICIQLSSQLPVKESSTHKSDEKHHEESADKPQDLQNVIGE